MTQRVLGRLSSRKLKYFIGERSNSLNVVDFKSQHISELHHSRHYVGRTNQNKSFIISKLESILKRKLKDTRLISKRCNSSKSDPVDSKATPISEPQKISLSESQTTIISKPQTLGSNPAISEPQTITATTAISEPQTIASTTSTAISKPQTTASTTVKLSSSAGPTKVLTKATTSSSSLQSEEWRSINPAATKEVKLFYFDTLSLANKFHSKGFSREQSVCMVEAFIEVLNTSIEHHTKNMVTKPEQEIMVQQLLAQIGAVKKDMVILEKSEFTMLRNENQMQTAEILQMKTYVSDEISKLKGHVKLDINLERSRSMEAHAENEKQLQIVRNKIDTDVANLKTTYEQYRNDIIKNTVGTIVSCTLVALAALRLMG
ncbi:mitochondrial calcium uniporter regulator 1-like [Mytilus trossulus]|uniref:mitochondrial calcium uniporter regulator 1-like n=1 Tax=Mytilus trossulus TaxID=6551 RepID=UPI0030045CA7